MSNKITDKDKSRAFVTQWLRFGDPEYYYRAQYPDKKRGEPPVVPGRRFMLDVAFPEQKVCIEVDGGIYGFNFYNRETGQTEHRRGGHSSISGQLQDMERQNLLVANGWRVLRFTPQQLDDRGNPMECIKLVLKTLLLA